LLLRSAEIKLQLSDLCLHTKV